MTNDNRGVLYLVGTPIGNLEDMTFRAIRILKEVELIAAEDTRNSIKLLNHFDIKTPMTSYHEYNRIEKAHELADQIINGKTVALITDAGMPAISDPGEDLVRICRERGIDVFVVPGPSAVVSALALSGLNTRRFAFEGFLPREKAQRKRVLEALKNETRTVILYEAPHHLKGTLSDLCGALGDRRVSIVKEITKKHERVLTLTLPEAEGYYSENDPRGESVLVVEGRSMEQLDKEAQESWQSISVSEHVEMYMKEGLDKKDAMKRAAKDRGVSKREIYDKILHEML